MIRLFGAFSALLAICPIGLYCAGSSVASPPSENGHCLFVLDGPKVVNIAGVNYVRATLDTGSCTLNAHTDITVCLSIEGDDSAGQCGWDYTPNAAVVDFPYRSGATYVVKGQGCMDIMQGSNSPATPTTVCQSIAPTRVTL